MWTLFVVLVGLTSPVIIDGYPTEEHCRTAGSQAVLALAASPYAEDPRQGRFWCAASPTRSSS